MATLLSNATGRQGWTRPARRPAGRLTLASWLGDTRERVCARVPCRLARGCGRPLQVPIGASVRAVPPVHLHVKGFHARGRMLFNVAADAIRTFARIRVSLAGGYRVSSFSEEDPGHSASSFGRCWMKAKQRRGNGACESAHAERVVCEEEEFTARHARARALSPRGGLRWIRDPDRGFNNSSVAMFIAETPSVLPSRNGGGGAPRSARHRSTATLRLSAFTNLLLAIQMQNSQEEALPLTLVLLWNNAAAANDFGCTLTPVTQKCQSACPYLYPAASATRKPRGGKSILETASHSDRPKCCSSGRTRWLMFPQSHAVGIQPADHFLAEPRPTLDPSIRDSRSDR
ncbi:unnamed protein product [Lampetra planeri]